MNDSIIINATQHEATPHQLQQGVVELDAFDKEKVHALLTFEEVPSSVELAERSDRIAYICANALWEHESSKHHKAMIGGANFLMGWLERAFLAYKIDPIYSFSKRVSHEVTEPDGSVKKVNRFKHLDFVEPKGMGHEHK